jgi:hypothetical protein
MTLSLIPTIESLGIGKKIFLKRLYNKFILQHAVASAVFLTRRFNISDFAHNQLAATLYFIKSRKNM